MGKHGPKSSHPNGYGSTTKRGYHRAMCPVQKRPRFVHVITWESAHGPVPPGCQIHHVNEDKQDNRLENLLCVNAVEHKRLHGGCELREGQWWKACKDCREVKPLTAAHWYFDANGWERYRRCRPCHIRNVAECKARRVARLAGADL
jgi:hypothetical protein